jgi:Phosphodiester glycosidase
VPQPAPRGPRYGGEPPTGQAPGRSDPSRPPHPGGPHPGGPNATGPHPGGSSATGQYPGGSSTTGQYPGGSNATGPYPGGANPGGRGPTGPFPPPPGTYPQPQPQGTYPQGQYPDARYQDARYQDAQYQDAHYQDGQYYPEVYDQDGYQQPGFRNPRTGSDYRTGDDYTMPRPAGDGYGYQDHPGGYADGPGSPYSPMSGYAIPGPEDGTELLVRPPGRRGGGGGRGQGGGRKGGRIRRFFRRPTVRVILALFGVFLIWVGYSVGTAISQNNGEPLSSKLAEWARDHYLGPVVTFGEWLSYNPPKTGGNPTFALTGPSSNVKIKKVKGFKPDIPARLSSPAGVPLAGEGVWQLQETVHGQPALYTTFLRVDSVHTSYVAGLASFDQRLVKFELRPGAQDPGAGFGGASDWIKPSTRTGLLATFNGGFRLNVSQGGFYLNGHTSGTLVNGAASVVYYRNGTVKVGQWGRDVSMTPEVAGVRQNLKLIVDNARLPATIDQNVETNFGATLGGAYYVWRSGIGITKDGRIIFVYGPSLSAHSLADLLLRAGAVQGMELDINPEWTSFEYYKANGHPASPTPKVMLPEQQSTGYRYYSPWGRDFTAVFAR